MYTQRKADEASRKHAQSMFDQEKQASIDFFHMQNEYNEKIWNKQNEYNQHLWNQQNTYNSPMNQMARFKEAGLNPNLIYGQNATVPPIAVSQFGKSDLDRPSGKPVHHSAGIKPTDLMNTLGTGLSAYNQFIETAARTNNLEEQNKILKQEAANKAIDNLLKVQGLRHSELDYSIKDRLKDVSVEAAEQALIKSKTETAVLINRDEREAAMNSMSIREAAQRILKMRGETFNIQLDSQLKNLDIELRRMGINPQDPTWQRVLGRIINEYGSKFQWDTGR